MRRTMTADTLHDYLSSAHMTVMLCRAHAEQYDLSAEQIADAKWRIELHIAELEGLSKDLALRKTDRAIRPADNIIRFPVTAA
ncbi:hypothetical protein PARHAE_00204 [Paracoccus haematequi]|uniref:Uncharacterized protein n=2 Tax=Paracoccaceae TaxID=31989 RepID=A0A447IHR7_9RHOB|nr:hypothetical protein PARHAE_00204 [Paracoccus haematequi]